MYTRKTSKINRRNRTRAKVRKFASRSRLCVFRSSKHIYAQVIDQDGKIIASASDIKLSDKITKTEKAKKVGTEIAKLALSKKVKTVVFDRSAYKYHGRVKALCEAARETKLTI